MNVLDDWHLSTEETVNVLGLSSQTRKRQLDKYRTLKAFPKDDLIIKRLSHIVGISMLSELHFQEIRTWLKNG